MSSCGNAGGETAKSLPECKAVLWRVGGWILDVGRILPVSRFQFPSLQFVPLASDGNVGAR